MTLENRVTMLPPLDATGVRYGDRTPAPDESVDVHPDDVPSLEATGWRRAVEKDDEP